MNQEYIKSAVNKLLGDYVSHGETESDDLSLQNLDYVEDILCTIIQKLVDNMIKGDRSYEWYVQQIGKRSAEILKDVVDMTPF